MWIIFEGEFVYIKNYGYILLLLYYEYTNFILVLPEN